MKHLVVKNWSSYQHYKDRDPPWVKQYQKTLTSEAWVMGSDLSRLLQLASPLLAARYENKIPYRWELLRKVCSLDCTEEAFTSAVLHLVDTDFLEVQDLAESCKPSASRPIATRNTSSSGLYSEERREEKRESRGETEHIRARDSSLLAERKQDASPTTVANREPDADDIGFARVKAAYPTFSGRQDWISAEHHCVLRIDQDGLTWDALVEAADRYRRWCEAEKIINTRKVLSPGNFYSAADKPWMQRWDLPAPPENPNQQREAKERADLERLMNSRVERGLSGFRDPYPHERALAYETQLKIAERDARPSIAASLAAAKRLPA